jgi:hypothetical protein
VKDKEEFLSLDPVDLELAIQGFPLTKRAQQSTMIKTVGTRLRKIWL